MAVKTNRYIQTQGIEIIPETDTYGNTTWMFRFTRLDGSRQSSSYWPGPFEALAEALHTLRQEGAYREERSREAEIRDFLS